jgi:hypothetical protein
MGGYFVHKKFLIWNKGKGACHFAFMLVLMSIDGQVNEEVPSPSSSSTLLLQ